MITKVVLNRFQIILLIFILYISQGITNAWAQLPETKVQPYFVKTWLTPAKAVPGQHIKLNILIGVDSYFTDATEFSLPEVEHALVLQSSAAANGQSLVDGLSYTTQQWQVDVYPNREGIMIIPAFNVSFVKSQQILGKLTPKKITVTTSPLLALIAIPKEMLGLPGFMVSTDAQIDDKWVSPKEKTTYTTGDVFERVVTITAANMTAMNMPQFNPSVPDGMSTVLAEPRLTTRQDRAGDVFATMEQHIHYIVESPGHYQVGGELLSWWQPVENRKVDHKFDVLLIDAGGIPWLPITALFFGVVIIGAVIFGIRFYLRKRDPIDLSIRHAVTGTDASKRLAALYLYADRHQKLPSEPAELNAVLSSEKPLIATVLKAKYSEGGDVNRPSLKEAKRLYRHIKKKA